MLSPVLLAVMLFGQFGVGAVSAHDWQVDTPPTGRLLDPSLALDSAGNPHISYSDAPAFDLKYAWYDGSTWQIETVDPGGSGAATSLALDPVTGYPRIGYTSGADVGGGIGEMYLKYAAWDGSAWQIETVYTSSYTHGFTTDLSLALDPGTGYPRIAYYEHGRQHYVAWDGSAWQIDLLWSGDSDPLNSPSLALDRTGAPRIAFNYGSMGHIVYATRAETGWQLETLTPFDEYWPPYLALDPATDAPRIAYTGGVEQGLRYSSFSGTRWETEDVAPARAFCAGLALDGAGDPRVIYISYPPAGGAPLTYAARSGTTWRAEDVDAAADVVEASLALGADGVPCIAYTESLEGGSWP